MKTSAIILCALVLLCLHTIRADLPVHCEFPQIKGTWVFQLTDNTYDKTAVEQCDMYKPIAPTQKLKLDLQGPNIAVSETGETGVWTLIYDQGFEIRIGKQNYFAYFNYTKVGDEVTSDCSRTLTGWYHEDKPAARDWGCFRGYKMSSTHNSKFTYQDKFSTAANDIFTNNEAVIKEINNQQSSWVAGPIKELEGKPLRTLATPIAKFRRDAHKKHVKSMKVFANANNKQQAKDLPASFDWRNVSSVSYLPSVRNQGSCGSCYAFATLGMYETRARIQTRNRSKAQYSPQDILSCSKYSQACDGGFPLLVSKHGYDFGFVEESCNPYRADSGECTNQCEPDNRRYVSDYGYIGGYYGASTEENMMRAIVENGPIVVGVEVYRDFKYYKGGVYHHVQTSFDSDPDPHFEVLNHAVVLVGYGEENGEKYWILRNSWGEAWGIEGGYMKIRKGVDECGIESEATNGHLVLN